MSNDVPDKAHALGLPRIRGAQNSGDPALELWESTSESPENRLRASRTPGVNRLPSKNRGEEPVLLRTFAEPHEWQAP